MFIYTGDESGLVKCVEIEGMNEKHEDSAENKKKRIKGASSKNVSFKKTDDKKIVSEDGKDEQSETYKNITTVDGTLSIARKNGKVELLNLKTQEKKSFCDSIFKEKVNLKVNGIRISEYNYVGLETNLTQIFFIMYEYGKYENSDNGDILPFTVKIGHGQCAMKTQKNQIDKFAVGGIEQELTLWDINNIEFKENGTEIWKSPSSSPLFKAKNVADNYLDMRSPVWVTNIEFLKPETFDTTKIVIGTGYGQVRVYDTTASNKPVLDWKIIDEPISSMTVANNQQLGGKKEMVYSAYLKQRMTCVDWDFVDGFGNEKNENLDDIWSGIETLKEKPKSKRTMEKISS
ncbi:hypothetical protein BB558_002667 [Smittium angustum]|uniref:Ribosome biogenesis protein NSA1 n=1 Tax=Smittium angustum TaxID=133377 RepID=A0A2U1J845_SMIAN|nr:hypothetical protein BB558_002667 [Smittium angustum]